LETIKEGKTIYPATAGEKKPLTASPADADKKYSWTARACDMADVNRAARKEWTLVSLNGKQVAGAKPPTIKFEHGKLSVFGGINRLSGSYALVDDTVAIGSLVSTRMAGDPALMEREQGLAKALASVDAFQVSGNELMLSSKGIVVARFRSAP
jgi:heat shock protein HslJ